MKIQFRGAIVAFTIFAVALSASAQSDGELKQQLATELRKIKAINDEIEEIKDAIKEAKENPPEKSVEVVKEVVPEIDPREEALSEVAALEEKLQRDSTLLEAYRNGYHVSSEVPVGTVLGNLPGPDGIVYENATLSEVSREGLKIKHTNGLATIPGALLSESVMEKVDVPPHNEEVKHDVLAFLSTKPDDLKSKDIVKIEKELAKEAKRAAERKKYEDTLAANKERRALRMTGEEESSTEDLKELAIANRKRHGELNEQKRQLLFKRRELQRDIGTLEQDIAKIRRSFEQKKVKADPKAIEGATFTQRSKVESHQSEVKAIDLKVEAILKEIRTLLNQ